MTKAQKAALKWLINRGGDGVFDRCQILMAQGELAPVMRSTWNKLEAIGLVKFYASKRRCAVTDEGRSVDLDGVTESIDLNSTFEGTQ